MDVVLSHKKRKSKKGIAIAIVLLAVSACVIAAIAVKQNIILQTTKKAWQINKMCYTGYCGFHSENAITFPNNFKFLI